MDKTVINASWQPDQTDFTIDLPAELDFEEFQEQEEVREVPRFNVVLLNDNDHSYEYVIEMLGAIFGYSRFRAFQLACKVDHFGRAIVDTTHRERAELKRDQIHAYGADYRLPHCQGSMSATIEPVEE